MSFFEEIRAKAARKKTRKEVLRMLTNAGWEGELPSLEIPKRELEQIVVSNMMAMYDKIMNRYCNKKSSVGTLQKEQRAFLVKCHIAASDIDTAILPIDAPLPVHQSTTQHLTDLEIVNDYAANRKTLSPKFIHDIMRRDVYTDSDIDDKAALYRDMLASLMAPIGDIGIEELKPELFAVWLWNDIDVCSAAIDIRRAEIEAEKAKEDKIRVEQIIIESVSDTRQPKTSESTVSVYDVVSKYIDVTPTQKIIMEKGIMGAIIHELGQEDDDEISEKAS
jgi:hypothetical protein